MSNHPLKALFTALLAAAGFCSASATEPLSGWLRANTSCSVTVVSSHLSTSYDLDTAYTPPGQSASWYKSSDSSGGRIANFSTSPTLTAVLPGYTCEWFTYARDVTVLEDGVGVMTQSLGAGDTLAVNATLLKKLYSGPGSATAFYAVLSPISYNLAYSLEGGHFNSDSSHPSSAKYDKPFTVSAPTRTGYRFAGWKANGTTYFEGETAAVTLKNLTTTDGATVSLEALWTAKEYTLQLLLGEGIARIRYRVGSEGEWQETTAEKSVSVGYDMTWYAYAEPAYGYKVTKGGTDEETATSERMGVSTQQYRPTAAKNTYEVSAKVSPLNTGRVTGGGAYTYKQVAELTATAESGYRFVQWGDGFTANPRTLTVLCDTNVVAQFKALAYELKLLVGEGVARIHYRVADGKWQTTDETLTLSLDYATAYRAWAEAKTGYTLTGLGSSESSAVSATMTTAGYVFEPKPTKNTYLVTVGADPQKGGSASVNGTGYFLYGERATVEANANTGYDFSHWKDPSGKTVSSQATYTFEVADHLVLTAVFKPVTYSVRFVYRDDSGKEVTSKQSVSHGESASAPGLDIVNCWPGHAFTGWNSSGWQYVTADQTITANYSAQGYEVRFDANGGTGKMVSQSFTHGVEQQLRANGFSRTGYAFAGWAKNGAGGLAFAYENQETVKDVTTDSGITLYALWEPISYTIRFEPGEGATGEAFGEKVRYDEAYALPANRFSHSVSFSHWKEKGGTRTFADGETVTRLSASDGATVTLVAQWVSTRQVRFNANYANASPQYAYQVFVEDVEDALRANTFTRTGYTFAGWTNRTGVAYADQQLLTNPAKVGETVDFYAVWKPITYQVIFDANGGTGSRPAFEATYDTANEAPIHTKGGIEKPSWAEKLCGWGLNATSLEENLVCKETDPKAAVTWNTNLTAIADDHIRLYAIWEPLNNETPVVKSVLRSVALTAAAPLMTNETSSESSEPTWTSSGWTDLGNGVWTNGAASAVLSATVSTAGTLTFDWMPSAVGDAMTEDVFDPEVICVEANRLKNMALSLYCGKSELKSMTGQTSREWQSATVEVTAGGKLEFRQNAQMTSGGTTYDGVYPCMLSNIVWTAAKEPEFTNEVKVVFEVDSKKGTCSGETEQTVEVVTNAAGGVIRPGYVKSEPTVTAKSGWSFTGWTNGVTVVPAGSITAHPITSNTTFGATFEESKPTPTPGMMPVDVTFQIDAAKGLRIGGGGTFCGEDKWIDRVHVLTNSDGDVTQSNPALEPTVVGINGWDFAGWYDETGKTNIARQAVADFRPTADTTLTARFEPHVYGIVYANVREHNNPNPTPTTFVSTNGVVALPGVTPATAYRYEPLQKIDSETESTFRGWLPAELKGGDYHQFVDHETHTYVYTNAVALAMWPDMEEATNVSYTVTFRYGIAEPAESNVTVRAGQNAIPPTVSNETGCVFTGWKLSNDNVTESFTNVAQYSALKYRLTYDNLRGRTHANPAEYGADDVAAGELALQNPEIVTGDESYRFLRWSPMGCVPQGSASNCAFTAVWEYRLALQSDGHVRIGSEKSRYVTEGEPASFAVEACDDGYSFAGWVWEDADGVHTNAPGVALVPVRPTTYTAVATANVYRVTFLKNGGEGEMEDQSFTYDAEQALRKNAFTFTDRAFLGWSKAVASPLTVDIDDEAVVRNLATGGVVKLTAVWSAPSPVKVQVSVSAGNGGSVVLKDAAGEVVANPGQFVVGTNLTVEATADTGWKFARWEGLSATSAKATFEVKAAITASAVFERVTQQTYQVVIDGDVQTVNAGETVTASTDASVIKADTNVVCVGWVGTGSVPASGTGNTTRFTVQSNSTLQWRRETQYRVRVTASDEAGTVVLKDATGKESENPGWYAVGSKITAEATADAGWHFVRWEGLDSTEAQTTFKVTKPLALTAVFEPGESDCTVTFVLDEHLTRTGGGALVQKVARGSAATLPTVAAAAGYSFLCWLDAKTGAKVVAADLKNVQTDRTITGVSVKGGSDQPYVAALVAPGCEGRGTVSGGNKSVARGKKLTLKATAAKGCVFTGWWKDGVCVSTKASYGITVSESVVYLARFISKEEDAASVRISVNGLDVKAGGATNVTAGIALCWPVVATGETAVTVAVSGLPSGLKLSKKATYDKTTGTMIPANAIYGAPSTPGRTSTVKITVTTAAKTKVVGTLAVTVNPLPAWFVANYAGGLAPADVEPAEDIVSGGAMLTVAKSGKISGKWLAEGKTWTLASTQYAACDERRAEVAVSAKCGRQTETWTLVFTPETVVGGSSVATVGTVTAQDEDGALVFLARGCDWKTAPWKKVASALKGTKFVVSDGDGAELTAAVGASGGVKVAGAFLTDDEGTVDPSGTRTYKASVTGTLMPLGDGRYELFLYYPAKAGKFAGYAVRLELEL